MMKHLVFQLYGPMASWGEIAVGERRASSAQPSKSAILGLVGAALGVRREEEERHLELSNSYGFALRIDTRGELLRDYHTTQAPTAKGGRTYYTRKDEVAAAQLNTILSQRDYRMDARYTIALWTKKDHAPFSLEQLGNALSRPRFHLYLGRKSCPLALPTYAQVVETETLREAFAAVQFPEELLGELPPNSSEEYAWEEHPAPGIEARMLYSRRDAVLSRRRWQFAERDEFYAALPREEEA